VKITYNKEKANVDPLLLVDGNSEIRSERGDAEKAFREAEIQIDETYSTPPETHVAMELHATVAVWDGTSFTLYETTQGVANAQSVFAQMLGVRKEQIRVISEFLGSGFGGKGSPWPHSALAAAAAQFESPREARGRPSGVVSNDRSSAPHPAAHPAWRDTGWEVDFSPAGLRQSHLDPG